MELFLKDSDDELRNTMIMKLSIALEVEISDLQELSSTELLKRASSPLQRRIPHRLSCITQPVNIISKVANPPGRSGVPHRPKSIWRQIGQRSVKILPPRSCSMHSWSSARYPLS